MEFLTRFATRLNSAEEKDSFQTYLLPHASLIYRSAYRLAGNTQDAEDLIQETFYYALKNFFQLRDRSKCKSWLFSILRNLFLKDVEKFKNRIEIEFDSVCESLHDGISIENDLVKDEVKRSIQDILSRLEERLRLPILFFYYDGKSYKEIAGLLDVPIGTVMSRIARAKVYLKRELIRAHQSKSEAEFLSLIAD